MRHLILLAAWPAWLFAASAEMVPPAVPPPHAVVADAEALVARLARATQAVPGYVVTLTKRQFIRGELQPEHTMRFKHRREPACRYLHWIAGPNEGREALHCEGRNDGDMTVHEGGFFGFVTLDIDPAGSTALRDDLRIITETGIYSIARFVQADHDHYRMEGVGNVRLTNRPVHDRPATCLTADGGTSLAPRYVAGRREVCIDDALSLPAEVRIWDTTGQLREHYTFRDYDLSRVPQDGDFDPDHPDYDF